MTGVKVFAGWVVAEWQCEDIAIIKVSESDALARDCCRRVIKGQFTRERKELGYEG